MKKGGKPHPSAGQKPCPSKPQMRKRKREKGGSFRGHKKTPGHLLPEPLQRAICLNRHCSEDDVPGKKRWPRTGEWWDTEREKDCKPLKVQEEGVGKSRPRRTSNVGPVALESSGGYKEPACKKGCVEPIRGTEGPEAEKIVGPSRRRRTGIRTSKKATLTLSARLPCPGIFFARGKKEHKIPLGRVARESSAMLTSSEGRY